MAKAEHAAIVGLLVALTACSESDGGGTTSGGGSAASGTTAGRDAGGANEGGAAGGGAAGGGTSSGGSTTSGPPISSAPGSWERPADCRGVGDLCEGILGCGDSSVCQAVGNVCIPAVKQGSTTFPTRSAEYPYCAAYTCMTFEEASCFCTGEAGTTVSNCSSPEALAGLCVGPGDRCDEDPCCGGLSCVDTGSGTRVCEIECTTSADCESGCCTDLRDTGVLVCADLAACENPCKKQGEACTVGTSTTPNDCCRGTCIESDNPDFAGCQYYCDTDADCPDTGCCLPFSNVDRGFCAPGLYCSCGEVGDVCGETGTPQCCDGTICAGSDGFTCRQACTADGDCPSGCCRGTSSGANMICYPADACPTP